VDRRLGTLLGVIVLVGIVIVVLATGGGTPGSGGEATGDVEVEGEGPDDPELADIAAVDVVREGSAIVFVAEMGQSIPERIDDGSLEWRWDLTVDGRDAWIVSAHVSTDVTAAVTSQLTPYGSSTIDQTMPGSVSVEGAELRIQLRPAEIDGFPESFGWRLATELDGDRADARSPVARDRAPDAGPGSFE